MEISRIANPLVLILLVFFLAVVVLVEVVD